MILLGVHNTWLSGEDAAGPNVFHIWAADELSERATAAGLNSKLCVVCIHDAFSLGINLRLKLHAIFVFTTFPRSLS
jgi:hypothetical protein